MLAHTLTPAGAPKPVYWIVDHDTHESLMVRVPLQRGGQLREAVFRLGHDRPNIPTGMQPPIEPDSACTQIRAFIDRHQPQPALLEGLKWLTEAWHQAGSSHPSLAWQIMAVMRYLANEVLGPDSLVYRSTSELGRESSFQALVRRLLADAPAAIHHYNQAVLSHLEAGLRPLELTLERIELPLWLLRWNRPREPIFADLADHTPQAALADGTLLDLDEIFTEAEKPDAGTNRDRLRVAPRALTFTAWSRSEQASLFIHGTGGALYDRVMETWWHTWMGDEKPLCPAAVASADVHIPFDVPMHDADDERHAIWWRHHLPHNIDRYQAVHPQTRIEKQEIIQLLSQPMNRDIKQGWFEKLKNLNRRLAEEHTDAIEQADRQLKQVHIGRINRQLALRRDWPLFAYAAEQLQELSEQLKRACTRP